MMIIIESLRVPIVFVCLYRPQHVELILCSSAQHSARMFRLHPDAEV